MVHQGERLPLGAESCKHLLGVHARLDHFKSDSAPDWLLLLGHKNHAEPALADLFQELVRTDLLAGGLAYDRRKCRRYDRTWVSQEVARLFMQLQQLLDVMAQ